MTALHTGRSASIVSVEIAVRTVNATSSTPVWSANRTLVVAKSVAAKVISTARMVAVGSEVVQRLDRAEGNAKRIHTAPVVNVVMEATASLTANAHQRLTAWKAKSASTGNVSR